MSEQADAVLIANSKFYRAFSMANPSVMRRQWAKLDFATCNHPGWHTLTGYESIQQSWSVIFVNQGPLHVWPTQAEVTFEQGIAWVTCVENVDATNTEANKIVCMRARNGFFETADGWKIVHHAAEPIPGYEFQAANQRLAPN
jgi:ketosteroid isomerase-like protein